jgi:phosphoribosylglycinamide formyltransferase-1
VCDDDDAATLAARVQRAEHRIYPDAVQWLLAGRVRVQDGNRVRVEGVPDAERLLVEGAS